MMEIPEGWSFERLDSHIDLLSGFAFKSAQYSEDTSDIKLLRGANVSQGNLRWLDVKYWPASETQELARYRLEAGDIVVSMDRTWIPAGLKVAVVKSSDLPSLLVQRVARLRAKSTLTQGLLATIIQSNRFVGHVKKTQTETAVPHISPKDIRDYKVYIAPLPEQQKIAKILRTWDRAIAATKALITASEAQKKALMQQLLTGKRRFPGFKDAWREVRLGDVADLTSGNAFKGSDILEEGRYRLIRMNDLKAGVLKNDEPRFVADDAVEGLSRFILHPGDFVFGMTGSLSNFAWISSELSNVLFLNQRVGKLSAKKDNSNRFLQHLYLSTPVQDNIVRMAAGAAQLNISLRDLRSFKISVPSAAEQQAIATIIDMAADETRLLKAKLQTLKTEKAALMQQLLTGKRRVKLTEAA